MKIFILTGSPHKNGTSNTLVKEFIKGAKESGHEIDLYDVAKGNIHPCLGCDSCGMAGDCVQDDDGNMVLQKILKSDCLVFATPVYYFGMSAQLKTMIDRFYARTTEITRKRLKAVLITTAWNNDKVVMKAIEHHFRTIFDYMDFENKGMLLAKGSGTVSIMPSRYYVEAFNLGKSL
ncbi:MAG: flavodoxin family protein [Candidatus Hodarchaeota archaeon]